jgi:hypothetical protein
MVLLRKPLVAAVRFLAYTGKISLAVTLAAGRYIGPQSNGAGS